MISYLKTQIKECIETLGHPVRDTNTYSTTYPMITLRLSNANREEKNQIVLQKVVYVIDIFSTYNGEKEILDINDKINEKLFMLPQRNKHITAMKQQNCLILDDKETGVVRKHGVLIYEFLLTSALGEVEE